MSIDYKHLYEYLNLNETSLQLKKARLFPSCKQPEQNIKHIFLACLSYIKPLQEQLLGDFVKPITNQSANLEAYSEITCTKESRPDALLVLTTGKKTPTIAWTAFLETKILTPLDAEQIERYYGFIKEKGFDCLITISNTPTSSPRNLPFALRKSKNFDCLHFSWLDIQKACLIVLNENKKLHHLEKYMLHELIRYFEDDSIRVKDFIVDASWKEDSAELFDNKKIKKDEKALDRVVTNWLQEEADICYHIYEQTALKVNIKHADKGRIEYLAEIKNGLKQSNKLVTVFRDESKHEAVLSIDFSSRTGEISMKFPPLSGQKHVSQITSILKKFEDAGDEHQIFLLADYGRQQIKEELIKKLQEEKASIQRSYSIVDKSKEIKSFSVRMKINFNRANDFHSPREFDRLVDGTVVAFFRYVFPALIH